MLRGRYSRDSSIGDFTAYTLRRRHSMWLLGGRECMPARDHQQAQPTGGHGRRNPADDGAGIRKHKLARALGNGVFGWDLLFLIISLFFSAMLMAIAISSPEYGWMAWLCLLPLFLAIQILVPLWAGIVGAFWGLWLYVFAAILGGAISPSIKSLLLLTGAPAIYAYGGACLTRWLGFRPFLLALGWIGVELILIPIGLSNGLLSGIQGESAQYHWISRMFGYVFLAFLIAGANVLLLNILCQVRVRIPHPTSFAQRPTSGKYYITSTSLHIRQLAFCRIHSRDPPC